MSLKQTFISGFALLVTLTFALFLSCAPQTTSSDKEQVRNKNSESVNENGGEVGIDDGSKITVPPGAVAVGSEVTVQKVADDPAFAAGGESASSTVEISGVGPDGVPIEQAAQPMTVALAIDSGASLNLSNLTGSVEDMCVMLKTISGKQMVWRRDLLTIDEEAKKVSLQSLFFGKYKAVYCGTTALEGFSEAGDTGATGAPPLTIAMTVPKDLFNGIDHGKYCFAAAREKEQDGCSHDPGATNPCDDALPVLAVTEAARAGADVELSLPISAGSVVDGYRIIVGLALLGKDATCEMAAGKDLMTTGPGVVNAFYAFVVDSEQVKNGLSGVIGSGDPYNLSTVSIKIGGLGNFASLTPHDEASVCVDVDGKYGKTLQFVNFAGGMISGEAEKKILAAAPTTGPLEQLRLKVGADCSAFDMNFGAVDASTGKPYQMMAPVVGGDSVLATPINLNITSTNPLLAGKNGCLNVYLPGSSKSNDSDRLGRIMINFDQPNYKIYLPYLTNPAYQSTSGVPKYDMEVIALKSGSCSDAQNSENQLLPPVALPGKELNASIQVSLGL